LKNLTIQSVGRDTALNTYVSQLLRDGAIEHANRSSV
tara:strand:- start:3013 stop:3123 length:111 start_codon:yes stop_codon:yes gene_type:complete